MAMKNASEGWSDNDKSESPDDPSSNLNSGVTIDPYEVNAERPAPARNVEVAPYRSHTSRPFS